MEPDTACLFFYRGLFTYDFPASNDLGKLLPCCFLSEMNISVCALPTKCWYNDALRPFLSAPLSIGAFLVAGAELHERGLEEAQSERLART